MSALSPLRFMLIGQIGAGKTTLLNALMGKSDQEARKTQAIEFDESGAIDTPGEYFSHPRLYHALITSAADVDRLVYVHPANDAVCRLPPGFLDVYSEKMIDAVITKTDLPDADTDHVKQALRAAGLTGSVFTVSWNDEQALNRLRTHLLGTVCAEGIS